MRYTTGIHLITVVVFALLAVNGHAGEICQLPEDSDVLIAVIWPLVDTDGSGGLSLEEVQAILPDLDATLFPLVDANRDGEIFPGEIVIILPLLPGGLLGLVDLNSNGVIEYAEVSSYVTAEQFALVDIDGNTVLDCHDILLDPDMEGESLPGEGELLPPPCALPNIFLEDVLDVAFRFVDNDGASGISLEEIWLWYPAFPQAWFEAGDGDDNGVVDREEALALLALMGVYGELVLQIDMNNDRLIQYEEVAGYVQPEQFGLLDINSNGVLDCEDWNVLHGPVPSEGEVMEGEMPPPPPPCSLPVILPEEMLDVLMPFVDVDGVPGISLAEIRAWFSIFMEDWFDEGDIDDNDVLDRAEALALLDLLNVHGDIVYPIEIIDDRLIRYNEVEYFMSLDQFELLDVNDNDVWDCEDWNVLHGPVPSEGEIMEGEMPPPPCGLPVILPEEILDIVFSYVDQDGISGISLEEIQVWYPSFPEGWFAVGDTSQDDALDREEALTLLNLLGISGDIVELIEFNHDRLIQYEEVEGYMGPEQFQLLDFNGNGVWDCEDWNALILSVPSEGESVEGEIVIPACPLPTITVEDGLPAAFFYLERDGVSGLSPEEIMVLYPDFDSGLFPFIDTSRNGQADMGELRNVIALFSLPGLDNDLVPYVDNNDDRLIQLDEALALIPEDQFHLLDFTGNGVLDCGDWEALLMMLPPEGELPPQEGEIVYPEGEIAVSEGEWGTDEGEPEVVPSTLPPVMPEQAVDLLFQYLDADGSDTITAQELFAAPGTQAYSLFAMCDGNGDNAIDRAEAGEALRTVSADRDVIAFVDSNGDRLIQYGEFMALASPELFAAFDRNGNDVLDGEDLQALIAVGGGEGEGTSEDGDAETGTGSLVGVVRSADMGLPIAGVTIRLSPGDREPWTTDGTGAFAFMDVPAGVYRLSADRKGYDPYAAEVDVPAGDPITVDIELTTDIQAGEVPVIEEGEVAREGEPMVEGEPVIDPVLTEGEDGVVPPEPEGEDEIESEVEVPEVGGLEKGEAIALLQSAGFTVVQSYECSDEVSEGYVIRQTPAGGMNAVKGATIEVYISSGACAKEASGCRGIPGVKFLSVADVFRHLGEYLLPGLSLMVLFTMTALFKK